MMRSIALVCFFLIASAGNVRAQDRVAEARVRFERGIDLAEEDRFELALIEFQRAYELAPAPPVLFNIAQVLGALGRSVEAVRTYEQYLQEARSLDPSRRELIEREMTRHRQRFAHITIETNANGATIAIDDTEVGTAPFEEPVLTDAGEHVISARAPGYEAVRVRVRLATEELRSLRLTLIASNAPRASIRVTSVVPGVEVMIDDMPAGLTPFDATIVVSPGPHRVIARRAGYVDFERSVDPEPGQEVTVELSMVLDRNARGPRGTLVLALPDARRELSIDGELRDGDRIELADGPHDIEVEVEGRVPFRARVDVPRDAEHEWRPLLEWTPQAARERHAALDQQFAAAIALPSVGVVMVAAGLGVFVWNQSAWLPLEDEERAFRQSCPGAQCDEFLADHGFTTGTLLDYEADLSRRINETTAIDWTGVILAITGGSLAVAGVVLAIATPTHGDVDRSAHASLVIGPGSISVAGAF